MPDFACFPQAYLLGTSSSMSEDHKLLSLNKSQFKIGRSLEVDLCLMDVNISRLHCVFSLSEDSGWTVTDQSSNGVWIGGVRVKKGMPTKIVEGDIVVLSELTKKYSWKFGLGAAEMESCEEPVAKKRKIMPSERGCVEEGKEEIAKAFSQRRKVAEVRMLREKLILENAVKAGQQKQAALMAEKEMLLSRLEDQTKKQNKKEREAREKLEKEMEGKDEREQKMKEFEEKIKFEREQQEAEKNKLVEKMEIKVKCEEEKRIKEVQDRDAMLVKLNVEKADLEKKFEKEKEDMEKELKDLQERLTVENSSKESKEKEWSEKLTSMNKQMEERLEREREDMEAAVKTEKEEKERLAREVECQRVERETELRKQEEVLETERATHAAQMEMLREEKEQKEEEMRQRNEEWEKRKKEQIEMEEQLKLRLDEMEKKKDEMAKEIEAERAVKAATEEESKARAARIAALEEEMGSVSKEMSGVKEESGKAELLSKLEETLESQYQCPTCLELFISPVALNCGHTYCWLCLAQWKGSSGRTRGDLGTCPTCREAVQHENRVFAIDHMIEAMVEQLGEDKMKERISKMKERKEAEEEFKATATVAAVNTANRGAGSSGRGVVLGRGGGGRGRGRGGARVNNAHNRTVEMGRGMMRGGARVSNTPPSRPIEISSSDTDSSEDEDSRSHSDQSSSTSSYLNDDSQTDGDSQVDSENLDSHVPGVPGATYGGFGRCFNCNRRGHWAPGCPF